MNGPKKRILIAYTTAGAGHVKAGMAIYDALKNTDNGLDLKCVDLLDHSTAFMRKAYPSIYLFLINKTSLLWGLFYYLTDIRAVYLLLRYFLVLINSFNCRKFEQLISDYNPDVVISTHFETTRIVSELKKNGKFQGKLISVITDLKIHSFWVADRLDRYVVGSKEASQTLVDRWNVDVGIIRVLGIPINPVFNKALDKDQLIGKLELKRELFNILIVSGGFGVGPIEELVDNLQHIDKAQLMVVCGKNPSLQERLQQKKLEVPAKIYGFVNNMHELMSAADIIITKSGGISTSEALAKHLPMVVIAPVPGQETRNCEVLMENNAAITAKDASEVRNIVQGLIRDPARLAELRGNVEKIAKPNSSQDIADLALSL